MKTIPHIFALLTAILLLVATLTGCYATNPAQMTPEQAQFLLEYQRASAAFQRYEDARFRRYQNSLRWQDEYLNQGRW